MRSGGACSPAGATRGSDAFGSYHPALVFSFFACAIVLGMFVRNPAFLAATAVFSGLYYTVLAGKRSLRMLAGMVALFIAVAVLNPLFNTRGDVVLFTYFDRPYTLEALAFGVQTAALLVGMLLWFSCYNIVMTSDKFTYLFGRMAPSATLVFTMVLRLIPAYHRKIDELAAARSGIGRSRRSGSSWSASGERRRFSRRSRRGRLRGACRRPTPCAAEASARRGALPTRAIASPRAMGRSLRAWRCSLRSRSRRLPAGLQARTSLPLLSRRRLAPSRQELGRHLTPSRL